MTVEGVRERRTRRVLIGLLVLVLTCGAVSMVVNLSGEPRDPHRIAMNQVYDQPVNHVDLEVLKGDITVEVAVDNRVELSYETYFFGTQPEPQHRVVDETLLVWFGGCGGDDCWVDYTIKVPESTTLDLSAEDGDISVREVSGHQELTTDFGNVSSTGGEGPVKVRAHGNVDIHDVVGDVDAQTESGHIELTQVEGNIVAIGDSGDITGISLRSDTVEVTADGGDVDLMFETAPEKVTVGIDSGDATVRVPDDGELYRVLADSGEEPVEVHIETSAAADRTIDVTVDGGRCRIDYR